MQGCLMAPLGNSGGGPLQLAGSGLLPPPPMNAPGTPTPSPLPATPYPSPDHSQVLAALQALSASAAPQSAASSFGAGEQGGSPRLVGQGGWGKMVGIAGGEGACWLRLPWGPAGLGLAHPRSAQPRFPLLLDSPCSEQPAAAAAAAQQPLSAALQL